ncbi:MULTISPECIES: hypothetical protein [Actinomadura]|uniref:hypothetical protein n=1 Tax=Actinomadura TaxID=1988 RepID=UPI0003AD16DB|nr:hypothetical protein [Actinomadura madurae]SPT60066.1 Uncharacterised protein [Actinomadura madurae]
MSVLSDAGVPIEDISRLAGHESTEVTETVYWHRIRPALLAGTEAMDNVFPPLPRTPSQEVMQKAHRG